MGRQDPRRRLHEEVNAQSRPWRIAAFRILSGLLGLAYLPGLLLMALPWAPAELFRRLPTLSPIIWAFRQALDPETQRWAFALSACVDGAIAIILLYSAWRPFRSALLVQFLVPALVVAVGANIPFMGPGIIVGYSPLLLIIIAYPQRRRLAEFPWRPQPSWPLLLLALALGAALLSEAWRAFLAQIKGADALAHSLGWASLAEHECNFWLITLFAASRRPCSSLLAFLAAACLMYLGAASICLPSNAGSWGFAGGVIAIVSGIAYIALGFGESQGLERQDRVDVLGRE